MSRAATVPKTKPDQLARAFSTDSKARMPRDSCARDPVGLSILGVRLPTIVSVRLATTVRVRLASDWLNSDALAVIWSGVTIVERVVMVRRVESPALEPTFSVSSPGFGPDFANLPTLAARLRSHGIPENEIQDRVAQAKALRPRQEFLVAIS